MLYEKWRKVVGNLRSREGASDQEYGRWGCSSLIRREVVDDFSIKEAVGWSKSLEGSDTLITIPTSYNH